MRHTVGSVIPLSSVNSFNPEMVRTMSAAFDSAWQQIAAARRSDTMLLPADATRERVARAIIKEARKGVTDPGRLVAVAMAAALLDSRLQPKSEQRIAS
jgi:hypothetical protein